METISVFPKGLVQTVQGSAIALRGDDIDTDRIIPARYLKCVTFEHLGGHVFADDRKELRDKHPFNNNKSLTYSILIVNGNFGCGSSREHAPQALMRWGIRAIIGESFAEIFYGNCLALGIPCVTSASETIKQIQETVELNPFQEWKLDLCKKNFKSKDDIYFWPINIEDSSREMLIEGNWDATAKLVANKGILKEKLKKLPYLNNFKSI